VGKPTTVLRCDPSPNPHNLEHKNLRIDMSLARIWAQGSGRNRCQLLSLFRHRRGAESQQLATTDNEKTASGLARERSGLMKAPHLFPGKSAILCLEMTPEIGP
jgi:hypothetical protein